MQVGLNTTSLSGSGALNPSVQQHTVAQNAPVRQKLPATASDYPASPLITTRPQRYSVQLNDQLTTLQQADHYGSTGAAFAGLSSRLSPRRTDAAAEGG